MKIAFVHDRIVHEGGAEMVLRDLISTNVFDDAKVFVLFSLHATFNIHDAKGNKNNSELEIITALPRRLNTIFVYFNIRKIPIFSKLFDYRNLMFWFPLLCILLRKKIKKYNANQIIISSFAAVKNIIAPTEKNNNIGDSSLHSAKKITLYLHSPMQYIRENYNENIQKLSFPIKQLYQFATIYLRPRDKKPRHYDVVLCNSKYTAKLAKQLYGLESKVIYPIVDKAFLEEPISVIPKEYFVFVGRVQKYVREIGTVIHACNETHTSLVVIGDGPDMEYAKSIAGPTIIFVGRIDDVHEKIAIVKHAKGLINIAKESFGIGTAEALCLGVPVLGYNGGATPEIISSKNGVLIEDKDKDIVEGIKQFCSTQFNRKEISDSARKIFFT